ncbi:MAG: CDF family Co(II)/Ni(II) efflux transporter DmeF [Rhodospirillaceae bacterium]|nr:CDF family Co(II)/Ni(II) efflux transporter DmeF [Rhodospirillaceae bacterium]
MHTQRIEAWQHGHVFLGSGHERNERRTWLVVVLTATTMVVEIVGGVIYGSMALMADGWHMFTHAAALAIAAIAYRFARRHARDRRFTFGTGKLGELAGFSSAMILWMVALLIVYESVMRLFDPVTIVFDQAIAIAVAGLIVNLISAWILSDGHTHGHRPQPVHRHSHDHPHAHEEGYEDRHRHRTAQHDHNLRGAYLHVMADALTSVLAIVALLAGRLYGWNWMDPVMGIVGAAIILRWSIGLIRTSGAVLLDTVPDRKLFDLVASRLEIGGDRLADLHLWRLGPGHVGLVASIVADRPQSPETYKTRLDGIDGLSHVTIEVHPCRAVTVPTTGA